MFGVNSLHTRGVFTQGCAQRRIFNDQPHPSLPRHIPVPWQVLQAGVHRSRLKITAPGGNWQCTRWEVLPVGHQMEPGLHSGSCRNCISSEAALSSKTKPNKAPAHPSRVGRKAPTSLACGVSCISTPMAQCYYRQCYYLAGEPIPSYLATRSSTSSMFISHHPSSSLPLFHNSLTWGCSFRASK